MGGETTILMSASETDGRNSDLNQPHFDSFDCHQLLFKPPSLVMSAKYISLMYFHEFFFMKLSYENQIVV